MYLQRKTEEWKKIKFLFVFIFQLIEKRSTTNKFSNRGKFARV